MPSVLTRVHGGIIDDQMLQGSLTFYEMVGPFTYTISDGSVILYDLPKFGGTNTVGDDKPVPRSAAELAFHMIMTRATICQINIIDSTTIQFAIENTSNGWNDYENDATPNSAENMQAAVRTIGSGITVPDNTDNGVVVDFTAITITEKPFVLV